MLLRTNVKSGKISAILTNDMLISSALNPKSRGVAQVSAPFTTKPDCTSTMPPKTHRLGFR